MKVKWFGHASFLFTSDAGVRVIVDPYTVGEDLAYGKVEEAADVVLLTHDHYDHNDVRPIQGRPPVLREPGAKEVHGIKFTGVPTFHDEAEGRQRGANVVFCFGMDGVRVCHLGDLGHDLRDDDVAAVGRVDVLCIPVGGYYTIDAKGATAVCNRLAPKVVFPMHYKTSKCFMPIAGVDDFLKGKAGVKRLDVSEVACQAGGLPASTEVIVLRPAL